eukprot:1160059-Pelagomonas_calceolata.AAC.1
MQHTLPEHPNQGAWAVPYLSIFCVCSVHDAYSRAAPGGTELHHCKRAPCTPWWLCGLHGSPPLLPPCTCVPHPPQPPQQLHPAQQQQHLPPGA